MTADALGARDDGGAPTVGREARLPSDADPRVRRVVGLVDTDSFAKWGAHLLATAPAHWQTAVRVVGTPRSASPAQLRAAFRGLDARLAHLATAPPVPERVEAILEDLRRDPPDAVLVALIGPVAELVIEEVHRLVPRRPVLLTGLPGISFPAKWKGVFFRSRADLFVLHSHREVRAYDELARSGGVAPHFALASLPFARREVTSGTGAGAPDDGAPDDGAPVDGAPVDGARVRRDSVVFAAQPSVPAERADRVRVVSWLVEAARRHPEWRVVLKVRATAGEHQTHREQDPYPDLLPPDVPSNLVVAGGPMTEHLDRAVALVTISSTAVLEAVARGVPALTLTDFGTSRQLINEVFVGSGLEGDSLDLLDGRFGTVRPEWMRDNHFHPPEDDDWAARADRLMDRRDAGTLVDRPAARRSRGGVLRRAWERKNALGSDDRSVVGAVAMVVGTPVRAVKRLGRRVGRVLRPGGSGSELPEVLPPTSQRVGDGAGSRPGGQGGDDSGSRPGWRGGDDSGSWPGGWGGDDSGARSDRLRHGEEELVARRDAG